MFWVTNSPVPPSMHAVLFSKGLQLLEKKIWGDFLSTIAYLTASLHSPEEAKGKKGRRKSGNMGIRRILQGGEVKHVPLFPQSNPFPEAWDTPVKILMNLAAEFCGLILQHEILHSGWLETWHPDELQRSRAPELLIVARWFINSLKKNKYQGTTMHQKSL